MKTLLLSFFSLSILMGLPLFAENSCLCGENCPCVMKDHCGCMAHKQAAPDAKTEVEEQK